ncbi:aminopeptidase P family protein [Mesorhizobium sp. USDA-HM6]|nr:aminopeptidase P family protein [Mesorhizobium sp. USDA-HM6]
MAMVKGPQAFPRGEYLRRLSAVKAEMVRMGINALLLSNSTDITYLSGYTAKSGYIPEALVISMKDEEPTFLTRRCDAPGAMYQMFFDSNRVIGYPENLIANPNNDGFDAIIDFLHQDGLARGRIGVEIKSLRPESIEKYKRRMPEAAIVDVSDAVAWIRITKSDLEIAAMREAAAITDAGMLRAKEVIRPGVREADAAAEIIATLIRGVDGKPSTDLTYFCLCASPLSATPHIIWNDSTFRDGSQINLECSGVRHGYVSGLMRTFSIGKPSDRLRRVHEGEVAGLEAALAAVKPGATCGDVASAFNKTLKKHGFEKESRCGYSMEIGWTEAVASLKEDDQTVLRPNMTFHLMLGNWMDEDLGYVISETFRVTDSGAEIFSRLPREIFEI